jgi:rhodanese-related sulfurtransferase
VVLIGAAALWIGWKYYQRRKFMKSLRVARIQPEELKLQLSDVVILDLRTAEEYAAEGAKIPGAIWIDRKEIEVRHEEIPRDRDVILYCT